MDEPKRPRLPAYRVFTLVAGGVLILLYAALVAIFRASLASPAFAGRDLAATPTIAATPHILVGGPVHAGVRHENFSFGLTEWHLYYPTGKMDDVEHTLVLQSNAVGQTAIAAYDDFIAAGRKYYVQAEFRTDAKTTGRYGLTFGLNESTGTFYLFELQQSEPGTCALERYTAGKWSALALAACPRRAPFPAPNTLSAAFYDGQIELYLNGESVLKFVDKEPLRSMGIGAYVSGPGFRLIADNFFAYSEQ